MIDHCIHQERGLCPACQADYDQDPQAFEEYGDHPAGLERWNRELQDILADMDQQGHRDLERQLDDEFPF